MESLQPAHIDNEQIVEIRDCSEHSNSNSEQISSIVTIAGSDSYGNPDPITQKNSSSVSNSKSNVIDMVGTTEDLKSKKANKTEDRKNGKMKHGPRGPSKPGIKDDLTIIAHISLGIYVVVICYLCLSNLFTFFTWHPLLLTIGWALLATEAVLFISKENPVNRKLRLNHTWKIRYHYILLTAAIVCVTIGCTIAFLNKNYLGKQHFKHWHGFFGLLTLIATTPAVFNGIVALFDTELKNFIKPSVNKLIHQASGTVAFIFGGITLILGVYTNWFRKNSGGNKYVFLTAFITVLYYFVWTLQRPFLKCLRKMFKLPI